MNLIKLLLGFAAILIAGCAAYFSVTGLGLLFSGASMAVMIMASSLEFAKLVTASYLKQKWNEIGSFNRMYLTLSVGVLMFITSLGIFGYLSSAFQQQNIKLQQISREVSMWESKITQDTIQINQLTSQITELNLNQSKIINTTTVNARILRSVDNRDGQISKLQDKIGSIQDSIVRFNEKINEIRNNNIGIEREVGGFRFVAEAFDLELNTVVKFFIILIVLVFDPLAIALVIAFNGLVSKKDEESTNNTASITKKSDKIYEVYGEIPINTETIPAEPHIEQIDDSEMEFIPDSDEVHYKSYYENPNFDWSDDTKWIGDKKARLYYEINVKPNI